MSLYIIPEDITAANEVIQLARKQSKQHLFSFFIK